jgi:hypothetical protein
MKIPRYRVGTSFNGTEAFPDAEGSWCKASDVKKLEELTERLVDNHDNAECWWYKGSCHCGIDRGAACSFAGDWDRAKRKCPCYEDKILRGYQPPSQEEESHIN